MIDLASLSGRPERLHFSADNAPKRVSGRRKLKLGETVLPKKFHDHCLLGLLIWVVGFRPMEDGAMRSKSYPTDLTDEQWQLIARLFTKSEKRGRKRTYELPRIINGCFYVLRGGIPWRMMPHDLPPCGSSISRVGRRDESSDNGHLAPRMRMDQFSMSPDTAVGKSLSL